MKWAFKGSFLTSGQIFFECHCFSFLKRNRPRCFFWHPVIIDSEAKLKLCQIYSQTCKTKISVHLRIHQIVSPISNSESSNIYYDFSFNWQIEEINCFEPIKSFVLFFNCSNWENYMEKIRETNWWKHLLNLLHIQHGCMKYLKIIRKWVMMQNNIKIRSATMNAQINPINIKSVFSEYIAIITCN